VYVFVGSVERRSGLTLRFVELRAVDEHEIRAVQQADLDP
jgi:hypothetical protein